MTEANTIWTTGYTADGFRVALTLDADADAGTVQALLAKLDLVRAAGITPQAPGLEEGAEMEEVVAVMRREKPSDGTPIVDFYPAWNNAGTFGAYKFCSLYLDTPGEIAEFEAQAGVKLADVPLYDGQAALKRTHGRAHAKEVQLPRPVQMTRKQIGTHPETGYAKYEYGYYRTVAPTGGAVDQPDPDDEKALFPDWLDKDTAARHLERWYTAYAPERMGNKAFYDAVLQLAKPGATSFRQLANVISPAALEMKVRDHFSPEPDPTPDDETPTPDDNGHQKRPPLPRARKREDVTGYADAVREVTHKEATNKHPLDGEEVLLDFVRYDTTHKGTPRWVATGHVDGQQVRVTLYREDIRLMEHLGYAASMAMSPGEKLLPVRVVLRHEQRNGLRVDGAWQDGEYVTRERLIEQLRAAGD